MISFFVRLPYISINYMEARTQLCINQKLSLMEPRHMKNRQWDIFNTKNILISNDKLRTSFAKYLSRFGHRIQYSVFEIDNSKRIVDNIVNDLTNTFEKRFSQSDSVYIFKMSSSCEVLRYGYAKNEENDFSS